MALTMKIKLLRALSVTQCWIAVWLVVLGIVERARVTWMFSALGMPIWTGVWVGITGSFGVFITFKRLQKLSHIATIPSHLVMTFMGFSLTCGILSSLIIFSYAHELAVAAGQKYKFYTGNDSGFVVTNVPVKFDARHTEQHALVGSIFAFTVVELILAMWSVAVCFVSDQHASLTNEAYHEVHGQDASGAAILSV